MARPQSPLSFVQGIIPLGKNNLSQGLVRGALAAYSTLGFPQFRARRPLMTLETPQVYVRFAVGQQGLGGLVAGGIVFQSLSPNPNPNQG